MNRVGSLEVGQDPRFQRYQWRAQRWAWGILGLVLIAALLGLTGNGPLSHATAETPDHSIRVNYNRFIRVRAPALTTIILGPEASPDGTVRLWIDRDYIDHLQVKHVTPRPESEEGGADRQVFVFRVTSPGEPAEITFHFEPEGGGYRTCRMGRVGGPELSFGQFVYP
jgi:hypothetical protein